RNGSSPPPLAGVRGSRKPAGRAGRLARGACARHGPGDMNDTLIIPAGFNGPRLSGNGGYVGGMVAQRFGQLRDGDGAVEITLRAPVPIDTPLSFSRGTDEAL